MRGHRGELKYLASYKKILSIWEGDEVKTVSTLQAKKAPLLPYL